MESLCSTVCAVREQDVGRWGCTVLLACGALNLPVRLVHDWIGFEWSGFSAMGKGKGARETVVCDLTWASDGHGSRRGRAGMLLVRIWREEAGRVMGGDSGKQRRLQWIQ